MPPDKEEAQLCFAPPPQTCHFDGMTVAILENELKIPPGTERARILPSAAEPQPRVLKQRK
jgi:hypothetical protein